MQHSFARLKYLTALLLAFTLCFGCNRGPIVYKVTSAQIRACLISPRDSCEPFVLERKSASQTIKVVAENLVSYEDAYQDEKEKAKYGEPSTVAYLLDTATARLYMEDVIAAKALKPIRSDRTSSKRDISLDLTNIPDGEYVIVFSWYTSEWDSPCKVIIKTL
jgi:hypothetical protein